MFYMPYILLFLKYDNKEIKLTKAIVITIAIMFSYFVLYYIKQGTKLASIDAPFLFMIQKTDNDLIHGFNIVFIIFVLFITTLNLVLWKKNKIKDIKKIYTIYLIIAIILIFPVNCFWHLRQSNSDTKGKILREDFNKVANYIQREYDRVYLIKLDSSDNECMRRIFSYLISDFETISVEDSRLIEINDKKVVIIVSKDFKGSIIGANKKNIDTDNIDIYTSDKEYEELKIELEEYYENSRTNTML